jgi:hypothetical protein
MKIRLIILLFLAMSLSCSANYSFLICPAVSSAGARVLDSTSAMGLSSQDPVVVQNFPSNITITGNLDLSGSSVVNWVGLSSSAPLKVYLYGSVFISDNATLTLKYANLYFMGAKEPYGCNITLSSSSGHPRLIVTDASIIAVSGASTHGISYSYGAGIYAYNKSIVTATGLSISRQKVSILSFSQGGPTEIECYGNSTVFLSSVKVDSMFTYGEANVTAYGGTFGGSLGFYNSSVTSLYGVTFPSLVVADNAQLILAHCTQSSGILKSTGHSIVDIINDTTMTSTFGVVNGAIGTIPGINATGDSEVYFLSSSTTSALLYGGAVVTVYGNATFFDQNGGINPGAIYAFDNSSVVFNDTLNGLVLQNVEITGYNSSSVSISTCAFWGTSFPITINLFGSSHLSIANSSILGGYFVFSDNSTAYLSNVAMSSDSRIIAQGNVNLNVVGDSSIEDSIELGGYARLSLKYSTVSLIYCPDSSQAFFVNGSVTELSVSNNSTVHLLNSTVEELSLAESNVTGSLSGLTRFLENSTVSLLDSGSQVVALDTTVDGLDFSFSGNSNVIISNSTLRSLNLQGSSTVTLMNSSVSAARYMTGNSTILLYSPLYVHCVDYFGNPLNGSLVEVNVNPDRVGEVVERGTTDESGWASFVFFSEIINATGSFPLGFAVVNGSFGGVSVSKSFSTTLVGKDVTLSFPLPGWSGYILPVVVLVGIVALLVLINYAYKRVRPRK